MTIKPWLAVAFLSLSLAACSDSQPTHTVDWYKAHDQARAEQLAKCQSNPGETSLTPNCINATKANDQKQSARRGWAPLKPTKE